MQGSIRSKLVVSLITLAVMVSITLAGSIQHTYAAGGNLLTSHLSSTPTPEPAQWTIQEGIPYATLPFGSYLLNIYTPNPAPQGNTPLVLYFYQT